MLLPLSRQNADATPQPSVDDDDTTNDDFRRNAIIGGIILLFFAAVWWRIFVRLHKRRRSSAARPQPAAAPPRTTAPPPPVFRSNFSPPPGYPLSAPGQGQFQPHRYPPHPSYPQPYPQAYAPPQPVPSMYPEPEPVQSAPAVPRFDPEDLASFEATGDDKSMPCAICLEPLETEPVSTGQCLHIMHTSCLKGWLSKDTKSACPVCRVSYQDSQSVDFGDAHDHSHPPLASAHSHRSQRSHAGAGSVLSRHASTNVTNSGPR